MSDFRHDVGRTWKFELGEVDVAKLAGLLAELETEGREVLADAGFAASEAEISLEADMRYSGQAYELTVPLEREHDVAELVKEAEEAFHLCHERAYGHARPRSGVEFTALRLCATGKVPELRSPESALVNRRPFESRPLSYTASEPRYALIDRDEIDGPVAGPALVLQEDATVIVPPAWRFAIDECNISVLERLAS
jgi:N-methylhydantoinase A